jgi:serine/threonine protein kinase
VEEIIGEAGIMTCLRHPKILQLYGCSLTIQAVWIVCELCQRGSLRMLLNDDISTPLSNEQKLSLCMDIADGMSYLHRRTPSIIHRDLKSHNIFIMERSPGKYVAKIGDWGSARAIALSGAKSMTHGVGTACWLAPEVINKVFDFLKFYFICFHINKYYYFSSLIFLKHRMCMLLQ